MEYTFCGFRRGCSPPFFSVAVYQPHHRSAWRLRTEPLDYRHAQNSGALIPSGGEWYSRSWVAVEGGLELVCPDGDRDLPRLITARIKISWWPAHVALTWLDGGSGFQKLSARPVENDPSEWISMPYDESVFADQHRCDFPRAFMTLPEPCPPRPSDTAPPINPPITATEEPKKEENSHSSHDTESDYDNGWDDKGGWWRWDWYSSQWEKADWSQPGWKHEHGEDWADAPIDTPRPTLRTPCMADPIPDTSQNNDTEQLPETSTLQTVTPNPEPRLAPPSSDASIGTAFRVEQVTQVTRAQSITEISRPLDDTQAMIRLQRMALAGTPVTREDRLARQALANRLTLAPEIYNMLVFGETPGDTDGHAINDTATCALPPTLRSPQSLLGDG